MKKAEIRGVMKSEAEKSRIGGMWGEGEIRKGERIHLG
jgi:hypothetical protein